MRRTGAQERKDNFKPKVTNNSLSRLPVELNLRSYERNRSLFSIMKIKEICNCLERSGSSSFLHVCLLILKKFNRVSWSLSSVRFTTTPLLIVYVKILSKSIDIYIYGKMSKLQYFTEISIFPGDQEPRFLENFV